MKFLPLVLLVFIAGCVQQTPITDISIPGHGSQIYTFSYDIRESVKVQSSDEPAIRDLLRNTDSINILYNGTNTEELPYATLKVAFMNIQQKLTTFDAYEGILLKFYPFYYTSGGLVNFSNASISNPTIEIRGPGTGAVETSVTLSGKAVIVQGTDSRNLQLAADKLALIFFGIDEAHVNKS